MKITKALIIVELDNSKELRQVFIEKDKMEYLIALLENGMFHDGNVTISDETIETIAVNTLKADSDGK